MQIEAFCFWSTIEAILRYIQLARKVIIILPPLGKEENIERIEMKKIF